MELSQFAHSGDGADDALSSVSLFKQVNNLTVCIFSTFALQKSRSSGNDSLGSDTILPLWGISGVDSLVAGWPSGKHAVTVA